jgi:hypothetical protein
MLSAFPKSYHETETFFLFSRARVGTKASIVLAAWRGVLWLCGEPNAPGIVAVQSGVGGATQPASAPLRVF